MFPDAGGGHSSLARKGVPFIYMSACIWGFIVNGNYLLLNSACNLNKEGLYLPCSVFAAGLLLRLEQFGPWQEEASSSFARQLGDVPEMAE